MSGNSGPSPNCILAVDDSPDNLFLIEAILDSPEFQLTCVNNGQQAVEAIRQQPFHLILLDVMMPGMDGYEVTRYIRQSNAVPYIPILLITAHDKSSVVEGLNAGADDFIRKPFDVNELVARVRCLLRLKHSIDAQSAMIRQRDDFVARLTHDLRTPLVAANRMLKFCQDETFGPIDENAKAVLGDIVRNNQHLLDMVNTLLEVHRHEAGQKTLAYSSFNLYEMAEGIVDELWPLANEKSLALKLSQTDETGAPSVAAYQMQGDNLAIRRVITNLVGNALKFTDEGQIQVHLQAYGNPPPLVQDIHSEARGRWLSLAVTDTGIGIAPDSQSEIFQWFRQGNHMRSGNGLGLHLAQRIAHMHGGAITLKSELGEGSQFTLWLPVEPPPEPAE